MQINSNASTPITSCEEVHKWTAHNLFTAIWRLLTKQPSFFSDHHHIPLELTTRELHYGMINCSVHNLPLRSLHITLFTGARKATHTSFSCNVKIDDATQGPSRRVITVKEISKSKSCYDPLSEAGADVAMGWKLISVAEDEGRSGKTVLFGRTGNLGMGKELGGGELK